MQRADGGVGITVKEYDPRQPLIITLVATFQPTTQSKEIALAKGSSNTVTSAAPSITATKTDQVIPDANNDGKANPGETIKYTVTIQNTGSMDATATNYSDAVDPNTTFTPGTFKSTPLAYDQTVMASEGQPQVITLVGNDPDGDNLTFSIVSGPSNGALGSISQLGQTAQVTYTSGGNFNGMDSFVFKVTDDDANMDQATVSINVGMINDPPSFTKGADQTVLEDAGPQTVAGWATSISAGPPDEAGQTLTFMVTNNTNAGLFSAGPAVDATTGNLTYTPAANANGSATITLVLKDNGGGTDTSPPQNFMITVTPVNDAPGFVKGANPTVNEDAGPQTVVGWATSISAGPANESGQTLTFNITGNDNPSLFSAGPAVAANGTLTYTPAANAFGVANISLVLMDNGGVLNGGVNTSPAQSFVITVNAVNDAPAVTCGPTQTITLPAGAQTVTSWATGISAGPANESGQTVTINVTNNTNTAIFSAGPAINATNGNLTYTPSGTAGAATITIVAMDNGGTANGGVNTSPSCTFVINIQSPPDAINDAPVANSVPGNAFHTALNTTLNSATDANTPSVLANDNLGFPAGTLASFGGGSLGGTVTSNAAGNTVTFGVGGSLQVLANGEFIFTPSNNFTGLFTFQYRLTNVAGFDDATATIAVGVRPAAVADARTATGNVRLSTATNLLSNDTGNQLIVTAFDASSAQGGNVTVAANGTFTYNPPAGYEGSDSFNYTVGNGFGNGPSAAVNITVSGMIWFINNTAAAGNGRLTSPFNTLAAFQAVNNGTGNNPAINDNIFIYTGSGSYLGGVTLLNNQKLIGDGSSSTLAAIAGITLAPGSDALPIFSGTDPTIENAASHGITLASGNTIRGLTVGNTPSGFGYSGGAVGTFNIQEASKTGTGGALNISTSGAAGTVQFDNLSSTSATSQAINLVSVTGTITVTSGSISGPTGTAVAVNGGNVSMTYPGNITQSNNASTVSVSNGHTGTLTFQTGTVSATNGNGLQFDNADGTYNFNGTTTLNGGDAGIDILNGSTGTYTFGTGTSITRGNSVSGAAFNLLSSNANVTYNGSMTLGTSTGNMVAIDNHDAGTMTFNTGNLTKGSSTTQGINISNSNGGSINFNNPTITITMTTGNAVSLTSNTGGTINFAISAGGSGMDLVTTSGTGFNATGGGTISVTGSGNTITSTTGTALNVASTTIGSGNLNFQSISSNGGTNGIILNTTGSGGLNVTGTGTTDGTGGTIQNTTGRGASFISASNITLKNMNFTNAGTSDLDATNGGLDIGDNLATNAAIHLQSVTTATLDNLNISGGAEQGINGNTVSNFTLSNSSIVDAGNEPDEDGIHFYNMSGTSAITSTTINCTVATPNTTGGDDHLNLQMQSGILNLTISGGSVTNANKGSGYLFGIRGTSNATIAFSSASSTNNFSGGIVADVFDTATMSLTVTGSTSSGNNDQLSVSAGDNSNVDLNANNNTLSSLNVGDFVVVSLLGSAFDTGYVFDARIQNNTITVGNDRTADGILANNAGGGQMNAVISGNTINYRGTQAAILIQGGQDGSGAMNFTVTGNNIDMQLDGTLNAVVGILANVAITGPGNTTSLCADIGGAGALSNTFTHSLGGALAAGDIRVRQRNDGTMRLPGYGGGATDTAAVIAYLNGRNAEVSSSTATVFSTGFAGGGACTQP